MSILEAIFLGIVQGVTEFLPVSSSGHLAIAQNLFHIEEADVTFDVMLHLATLIAVCAVYWKDVKKLVFSACGIIADFFRNIAIFIQRRRGYDVDYIRVVRTVYRKFTMLILVSTIFTVVIALPFKEMFNRVGGSLLIPGLCLILTAIFLRICDFLPVGKKTPRKTNYVDAGIIGFVQGIATLPGISRSGATITACVARGLRRDFAVKYSFLMSIPAILGAVILDLPKLGGVSASVIGSYLVGMLVAGVVGYVCVRLMINLVKYSEFKGFSYYCGAIGMISIICYFALS